MRVLVIGLVLVHLLAAEALGQDGPTVVEKREFRVTSAPAGATFSRVDNKEYLGTTNTTVNLFPNQSYNVIFKLPGYVDERGVINPDPVNPSFSLHVDLRPATPAAWVRHQYAYNPALAWPLTAVLAAVLAAGVFFIARRFRRLNQRITEAELESPTLVGRVVGDFRIDEKLGEGAFSEVYRVENMTYHDQFAMKVLKSDFLESDWLTRFHREMEVGRDLQHPNLVRVFAFGEIRSCPYIVMELLKGRTLDNLLALRKPSMDEALDMTRQICQGLGFAHKRGVVHRDLKPDNIMVLDDGTIRIMDFGIAKFLDRQKLTVTGAALGTPRYMSPEHLNNKAMDARSDIYSLGVILYQMLNGEPPFTAEDTIQVITAHMHTPPPPLKDVPKNLEDVVMKMLAKKPDLRFQTLEEVEAALAGLESMATERGGPRSHPEDGQSPILEEPAR